MCIRDMSTGARTGKMKCVLLLLPFLALSAASNCSDIVSPIVSGVPVFAIRPQSDATCVVECDYARGNVTVLPCVSFADAVTRVMTKAGLNTGCFDNRIEAPGEEPGTSDPEMITKACPDWFLYLGWDRGVKRVLGTMRQEVLLKSPAALTAFMTMIPKK
eukprot:TRINITY_DN19877_c0_g1_i1.p1 TRINITY_DN19877_c0_g1~~TRINITY_DN19877_c0_g1_i1.p1  ORF type:complete len:160 (-),score=38.28 TRINITY_DN19877_c0_g1_i1:273-752(-)